MTCIATEGYRRLPKTTNPPIHRSLHKIRLCGDSFVLVFRGVEKIHKLGSQIAHHVNKCGSGERVDLLQNLIVQC
jgi:hypothetical protein